MGSNCKEVSLEVSPFTLKGVWVLLAVGHCCVINGIINVVGVEGPI